jgi:uncharacterized ParB-like nuclease family protein
VICSVSRASIYLVAEKVVALMESIKEVGLQEPVSHLQSLLSHGRPASQGDFRSFKCSAATAQDTFCRIMTLSPQRVRLAYNMSIGSGVAPLTNGPGQATSCVLLQIDVLLVDGKYYGFSGCHRFEVQSNSHISCFRLSTPAYDQGF